MIFLYDFNNFNKNCGERDELLFYSRTLQVAFWNIETWITGICAWIVLVHFSLEWDFDSEKKKIFLHS